MVFIMMSKFYYSGNTEMFPERKRLMKNVFLFGYYGFENTGDEAILQAIVEQFRQSLPDSKLTALTYRSQDTIDKYGIGVVSRNNFKGIYNAIKTSDIVISGGGSLLQDITSSRSLIYYLSIIYIAKKFRKKVMFYGNGFGPITKSLNKKLVKYIINQVDIITVRDYKSKEKLKALGIKKDITITADATFSIDIPSKETIESIYNKESIDSSKKLIGVSVRRWHGENQYKEIIGKACDKLISKGYEVVFVPMQYPEDIKISEEIASLMDKKPKIIKEKYTPKEVIGIISGLYMLIGMRLHSLIFATIGTVPMVGLEYDPKILSFLDLVNQKSAGNVEDLDINNLLGIIDKVIKKREYHKESLIKYRDLLKKNAELNIKILEKFL